MPTAKRRRHTPQRQVILEELNALHTHPTAGELYALVRRRLPRVSLGTVYRNLDVLCEEGLATRLASVGNELRYDGRMGRHDHVRCTACGCLRDLDGPDLPVLPEPPSSAAGFSIRGRRLEYFGLCPDCQRGGRTQGD